MYRSDYLPDPDIPHGSPRAVPLGGCLHGGHSGPQLLSRLQTAGQVHLQFRRLALKSPPLGPK